MADRCQLGGGDGGRGGGRRAAAGRTAGAEANGFGRAVAAECEGGEGMTASGPEGAPAAIWGKAGGGGEEGEAETEPGLDGRRETQLREVSDTL